MMFHKRPRLRSILRPVALFLLLNVSITAARGEDDKAVDMETILKALAARQDQTRTARFEWTQVQSNRSVGDKQELVSVTQHLSLRLDLDHFDLRISTPGGSVAQIPESSRSAFDGESTKQLSTFDDDTPYGLVSRTPHHFHVNRVDIRPLLFLYRALHPTMGRKIRGQYRVRESQETHDGYPCIVLDPLDGGEHGVRDSYWLDPSRGYLLVRFVSTVHGKDSIRQDITYTKDVDHGWVPTRWKHVFVAEDGTFLQSITCKVDKYEINAAIPQEDFQVEFTADTRVYDVDAQASVPPEGTWLLRTWMWWAIVCTLVIFVCVVIKRRYFRHPPAPQNST